jgi:hypothetical protein
MAGSGVGSLGHCHPTLARVPGYRRRLPRTRSGSEDGADCNGGTDRIRVIPQMGWLGVSRQAQVAAIQP